MAKPTGFMEFHRHKASKRPVAERLKDWKEYELAFEELEVPAANLLGEVEGKDIQQIVIGVIIVLAVAFDTFAKSRQRRL